ncbi:MAG TPA: DoxX family protein [Candidatus Nanopelagicaceae bacterium]
MSIVLALMVFASASIKLRKSPQVMEFMNHVGVKPDQIKILALLEAMGGIGLLVGFASKFIGIAAAAGIALYFAGAIVAHIRKKDKFKEFVTPSFMMIFALITLWLQIGWLGDRQGLGGSFFTYEGGHSFAG